MAVYQCYFALAPKGGVLAVHGMVPEQISVTAGEDGFEHNTAIYWARTQVQATVISREVDTLLPSASWGNGPDGHSWKMETKEIDVDASLGFNPTSGWIEEFSFRFDLRDPEVAFLRQMLTLARGHDLLLMDDQGRLSLPEPEPVWALVKQSRAYLFMTDRESFWQTVAKE
ncbi:MAG: hypothetical protein AAF840_01450 [Bacteroidota bacterium]